MYWEGVEVEVEEKKEIGSYKNYYETDNDNIYNEHKYVKWSKYGYFVFAFSDSLSILHLTFCSGNVTHVDSMLSEGAKKKLLESKWIKELEDMFYGGIQSTLVIREENGTSRIISPLYFHTV